MWILGAVYVLHMFWSKNQNQVPNWMEIWVYDSYMIDDLMIVDWKSLIGDFVMAPTDCLSYLSSRAQLAARTTTLSSA